MKLEDVCADEAIAAALVQLDALEECTRIAIAAELRALVPVSQDHVTDTAEKARAAEKALEAPESALEILRADMADLDSRARLVEAQCGSAMLEDRVEARVRLSAYEHEIGLLSEKIRIAERELAALVEKRNLAHSAAEAAIGGLAALADAISNPFTDPLGQATDSYKWLRAPMLWQVLLTGDDKHPEWEQAIRQMVQLCKISGFRTEDFKDELPSEADHFRRMWDAARTDPEPAPSGQEVIASTHLAGRLAGLNTRNKKDRGGRIEDHRIPGMPKPVPERDYMQVQRLSGATR